MKYVPFCIYTLLHSQRQAVDTTVEEMQGMKTPICVSVECSIIDCSRKEPYSEGSDRL